VDYSCGVCTGSTVKADGSSLGTPAAQPVKAAQQPCCCTQYVAAATLKMVRTCRLEPLVAKQQFVGSAAECATPVAAVPVTCAAAEILVPGLVPVHVQHMLQQCSFFGSALAWYASHVLSFWLVTFHTICRSCGRARFLVLAVAGFWACFEKFILHMNAFARVFCADRW